MASLLALVPAAQAHLPEYLGRRFVPVIEANAAQDLPTCGGDAAERERLRAQADALEERLAEMQRVNGAYTPLLADPSGELAKLQATLCNHPAALDANRRAIQSLRINEGLLTERQLPQLRALADSYAAIGDYQSAQRTLRYAFRIHNMGRGELSPAALRDSLAYFERARELFIDPRTSQDIPLFFEAYDDNRAMYEAQWQRFSEGDGPSYEAIKAIALSHLYNFYLVLGTDLMRYGSAATEGAGGALQFMQQSQLLTYGRGRDLIEKLLERPELLAGAERAFWLWQLGNWQQWNGKWQSACDSLEAAWAEAQRGGDEALLRRLAQPAELPEDTALWRHLLGKEIPVRAVIVADLRVSARGDIGRVRGETVDGAGGGQVLRWLRDSHARPALRGGRCVEGELNGRRYHLVD
jgi:hypothetical protein